MRIGVNLVAGMASAGWSALLGFLVVPLYLRWLGIEAYGLIGFFATLQGVFALVDLGMTSLMTREVARGRAMPGARARTATLLHSVALIYWGLAALILTALALLSGPIARDWLNAAHLDPAAVRGSVALMAVVVACRVPLGIYNGAVMGAERIVLFNAIAAAMVTLSSLGAVMVLAFVSPTVGAFFAWQAAVAGLQLLVTRRAAWWAVGGRAGARFDGGELRRVRRFAAGMSVTAVLGIAFSQADKVALSRMAPLSGLGVYSLAWVLTRALYLFVTPAFNVAYPRMSALHAAGDEAGLARLHRTGTRMLLAAVLPLATFLAVFGGPVVTAWTGDAAMGGRIAPVLGFVMLGTALNAVMYFPYALQLACGRSGLSAAISLAMMAFYLPLLVVLTRTYGMVGAAAAWAAYNAAYVLAGTWLTHRVLLAGVGRRWLMTDVGLPAGSAIAIVGGGGLLVRSAGLPPLPELMAGAGLTALATATVAALSPALSAALAAVLRQRPAVRSGPGETT